MKSRHIRTSEEVMEADANEEIVNCLREGAIVALRKRCNVRLRHGGMEYMIRAWEIVEFLLANEGGTIR